jgi:pimeloyl-ACP methyl ester carboxylesterase
MRRALLVRLLPFLIVLTIIKDSHATTGSTTGSSSFLRRNLVATAGCDCGRRLLSATTFGPRSLALSSNSISIRGSNSRRCRSTSGTVTAWTWQSLTTPRRIDRQGPFHRLCDAIGSIPFNRVPSGRNGRSNCPTVALESSNEHHGNDHTGNSPFGWQQRAFYTHTEPDYLTVNSSTTAAIDSTSARADPNRSYNISYHYQPASVGWETVSPILLIHPVGIGMASWFWNPLHQAFTEDIANIGDSGGHPALYAVNLVGCGITEQNAALTLQLSPRTWSSENSNAHPQFQYPAPESVPWLWIRQCETLIHAISTRSVHQAGIVATPRNVTIVAQGGLAPIALALARRNPETVSHLVLTSPPIWTDLTICVPESALSLNVQFLCSPLGRLAFALLETRAAVQFFSNAFLFASRTPVRLCGLLSKSLMPVIASRQAL